MTRHISVIKMESGWGVSVLDERAWRETYSCVIEVRGDRYMVYSQLISKVKNETQEPLESNEGKE